MGALTSKRRHDLTPPWLRAALAEFARSGRCYSFGQAHAVLTTIHVHGFGLITLHTPCVSPMFGTANTPALMRRVYSFLTPHIGQFLQTGPTTVGSTAHSDGFIFDVHNKSGHLSGWSSGVGGRGHDGGELRLKSLSCEMILHDGTDAAQVGVWRWAPPEPGAECDEDFVERVYKFDQRLIKSGSESGTLPERWELVGSGRASCDTTALETTSCRVFFDDGGLLLPPHAKVTLMIKIATPTASDAEMALSTPPVPRLVPLWWGGINQKSGISWPIRPYSSLGAVMLQLNCRDAHSMLQNECAVMRDGSVISCLRFTMWGGFPVSKRRSALEHFQATREMMRFASVFFVGDVEYSQS